VSADKNSPAISEKEETTGQKTDLKLLSGLLVVNYKIRVSLLRLWQILGMDEPMFFIRSLDVPSAGRILVR